jgi:hypothetical protein
MFQKHFLSQDSVSNTLAFSLIQAICLKNIGLFFESGHLIQKPLVICMICLALLNVDANPGCQRILFGVNALASMAIYA